MDNTAERFDGVARLLGQAALRRLQAARVAVIGLGGVGSWVAEALARSGVGGLRLVDRDTVCASNLNRQLPALTITLGQPKATVLAERLRAIHPEAEITTVLDFFTAETAEAVLAPPLDFVVDAIDTPALKAHLVAECQARKLPVILSGGAGGRRDPTQIRVADLANVTHDGLLAEVRRRLRRDYGFPPAGQPLGVECVFSPETPEASTGTGDEMVPHEADRSGPAGRRYGTACFVTGAFGFALAARVVRRLAG
jgi:tRNA A37 threonylcarbamoyladenosine dehydratase